MHDERGREIPDPVPVEVPIQWRRPPTIQEQIKMFVRRELSQRAADEGAETFEEADDFDVGDDYDPTSPYEENYDPEPVAESAPSLPGATDGKPGPSGPSGSPEPVSGSGEGAQKKETGA